jgi:hypothetical protein
MRICFLFPVCIALGLMALSGPALGQMWRSHGRSSGYSGWGDPGGADPGAFGALGSLSATAQYNNLRTVQSNNQVAGMNIAAQQQAALQSSLRNTAVTQAQTRTQNILGQQQANQDWWFQVQQQQVAQRQAMAARMPPSLPPATSFEPGAPAETTAASAATTPAPADDVMQWPTALQDSRFAALRGEIEAPYRRTPGKISYPTPAEYLAMLGPIEKMRGLLGQMTADISARDYLDADKFLNLVRQQAQDRGKPKP